MLLFELLLSLKRLFLARFSCISFVPPRFSCSSRVPPVLSIRSIGLLCDDGFWLLFVFFFGNGVNELVDFVVVVVMSSSSTLSRSSSSDECSSCSSCAKVFNI